jgi:hypothetical protein
MSIPTENTRWIRMPNPGEMRGEGEWKQLTSVYASEDNQETSWNFCLGTGYLPTFIGEVPPSTRKTASND